jgi:hypothetical protein
MISKNSFVQQMVAIRVYNETLSNLQNVLGVHFDEGPFMFTLNNLVSSLKEDTGYIAWGDGMPMIDFFIFEEPLNEEGKFVHSYNALAPDEKKFEIFDFDSLWEYLSYVDFIRPCGEGIIEENTHEGEEVIEYVDSNNESAALS